MTLPPGLIAFIYRLRWDVEKVFDEFENKLGQRQAWGKQEAAKTQQAHFITLGHNLMLMIEDTLATTEGIVDEKVRLKQVKRQALEAGRAPNIMIQNLTRATQRSLQFIRWLRMGLTLNTSWQDAVVQLRPLMLRYLS